MAFKGFNALTTDLNFDQGLHFGEPLGFSYFTMCLYLSLNLFVLLGCFKVIS